MYEVLNNKSFFEKFKDELTPGEFKFITKAFRRSDNTVAIFDEENNVDCYFQLPSYKTTKLPEDRRWIYKLSKGSIKKGSYILMEDNRYKIPVDSLTIWKDPYNEPIGFKNSIGLSGNSQEKTKEQTAHKHDESLLEKIDRLSTEVEERIERLETAIKKLIDIEEKVLKALKKIENVDKS